MENEPKVNDLENRLSALESQLKAALRSTDAVDPLGDPLPSRDPILLAYKRTMWKYFIVSWSFLVLFTVWALFCLVSFGQSGNSKDELLYIAFFLTAILGTVLIKLWYWQVWNRYSIVREVKRLELCIVELTEKLEKQ